MKDVIEQKKYSPPKMVADPNLNKYDNITLFPEKLKRANELLAKAGLPEEVANKLAEKGQKHNFWTNGIVIQADAKENTFSLTVKTRDKLAENTYIISTSAEILNKIVKQHWADSIKVFLRPKAIIGQPFQYDLIEIQ